MHHPLRRSLPSVLLTVILAAFATTATTAPPTPVPAPDAPWASGGDLARDGSGGLMRDRLAGVGAPDRLDAVVLMCDFADSLMLGRHGLVPGDFPPPAQTEFLYSAHDAVYFEHLMDDVSLYFDSVSGGRFELAVTVIEEVVNLPHPMAWYGNHPDEGEQKILLAKDVVEALDDSVDFSLYDTVLLIHAGAGEETDILGDSPEQIYSSYLSPEDFAEAVEEEILEEPWIATDDVDGFGDPVVVDQVLVLPETEYQDPAGGVGGYFGSLGVYCFEVGLRLGMLSLSDFTPSGRPDSQGIGQFGLMGYGLFTAGGLIPAEPCAFNRMLMGWVDPLEVDPDAGETVTLMPAEHPSLSDSTLARVAISPSEYWLAEYRLQDPDGNRIFSFGDDRNGNGIPDFTRLDDDTWSPYFYDPETETWSIVATFDPEVHRDERLLDAEWDFYMSDNTARPAGVKGAGSGLYVWHVDEGVIAQALDADRNVFNADPDRKSVDLEEADGIQDLDTHRPSAWSLGGDDDSFREEGASTFGPGTEPSSASAGGAWTGVVIDAVSAVVVDSSIVDPEVPWPVIDYATIMTFLCSRESAGPGAPELVASLDLPDVDMTGSHLLAVDLDDPQDGVPEIVAVGDEGRVFAWRSDLTSWIPDAEPVGLLAIGTDAEGEPVEWTGPPAAGDVDGDGVVDIVINAPGGVYVFDAEGGELRNGDFDPDSFGLALEPQRAGAVMQGAPVIVDDGFADVESPADVVIAVLEWEELAEGHGSYLTRIYDAASDEVEDTPWIPGPFPGRMGLAGPVLGAAGFAALGENLDGTGFLATENPLFGGGIDVSFVGTPAPWPSLARDGGILVPLADGGCLYADLEGAMVWDGHLPVRSPLAPGLAYATDGGFVRAGRSGAPETSWPHLPAVAVSAADESVAPSPLSAMLGDGTLTLFASRDGRLFLCDDDGDVLTGWPLAGAGATAGTPLLMDLDGVSGLEVAAVGSATRLVGHDPDGEDNEFAPVSRLAVWSVPGTGEAEGHWPMWRGAPSRSAPAPGPGTTPGGEGLLAEGTVFVSPAPARGDRIAARAVLNDDAVLRAFLYNLEGEEVSRSAPVRGFAGEAVEAGLDISGAVSGTYICRIVAEGDRGREVAVKPAAIAR